MRLTADLIPEFLDRFHHFEDGVITGLVVRLPRGDLDGRAISFDVQAVDGSAPGTTWRLVTLTVHGIEEFRLRDSLRYPTQVLSDGLAIGFADDRVTVDLDPGPDEWNPEQVHKVHQVDTGYSRQFVIGRRCEFEVGDGPFI